MCFASKDSNGSIELGLCVLAVEAMPPLPDRSVLPELPQAASSLLQFILQIPSKAFQGADKNLVLALELPVHPQGANEQWAVQ